jgi:hypothetical protein
LLPQEPHSLKRWRTPASRRTARSIEGHGRVHYTYTPHVANKSGRRCSMLMTWTCAASPATKVETGMSGSPMALWKAASSVGVALELLAHGGSGGVQPGERARAA